MDYYKILELPKDASLIQIAQNYRRLSLRHHPLLSKNNMNETYRTFCSVAEAYEVLSQDKRRQIYDSHGSLGLKNGVEVNGELIGYAFDGNPEQTFENFFGSSNPYTQIYDKSSEEEFGSLLSYAYKNSESQKIPKPKDLEIFVECTLEELYNGCQKTITYAREKLNEFSQVVSVNEQKSINIIPGYKEGSRIEFANQGNEVLAQQPSNLVFIIKQIRHKEFRRDVDNLIYTKQISLLSALLSEPISITCLDGRKIVVSMDSVINPNTKKQIKNQGMPIFDPKIIDLSSSSVPQRHGDLIVQFDIEFPLMMSEYQKTQFCEILS